MALERLVGHYQPHILEYHELWEVQVLLTGFQKREAAQEKAADRAQNQAITVVRTESVSESLPFLLKSPTKI